MSGEFQWVVHLYTTQYVSVKNNMVIRQVELPQSFSCIHIVYTCRVWLQTLNIKDAYADDRFDRTVSSAGSYVRLLILVLHWLHTYSLRNRSRVIPAVIFCNYANGTWQKYVQRCSARRLQLTGLGSSRELARYLCIGVRNMPVFSWRLCQPRNFLARFVKIP